MNQDLPSWTLEVYIGQMLWYNIDDKQQCCYVIVIPRSPGIYRGKPPDPEGAARGRGVVFHDKSMVTVV